MERLIEVHNNIQCQIAEIEEACNDCQKLFRPWLVEELYPELRQDTQFNETVTVQDDISSRLLHSELQLVERALAKVDKVKKLQIKNAKVHDSALNCRQQSTISESDIFLSLDEANKLSCEPIDSLRNLNIQNSATTLNNVHSAANSKTDSSVNSKDCRLHVSNKGLARDPGYYPATVRCQRLANGIKRQPVSVKTGKSVIPAPKILRGKNENVCLQATGKTAQDGFSEVKANKERSVVNLSARSNEPASKTPEIMAVTSGSSKVPEFVESSRRPEKPLASNRRQPTEKMVNFGRKENLPETIRLIFSAGKNNAVPSILPQFISQMRRNKMLRRKLVDMFSNHGGKTEGRQQRGVESKNRRRTETTLQYSKCGGFQNNSIFANCSERRKPLWTFNGDVLNVVSSQCPLPEDLTPSSLEFKVRTLTNIYAFLQRLLQQTDPNNLSEQSFWKDIARARLAFAYAAKLYTFLEENYLSVMKTIQNNVRVHRQVLRYSDDASYAKYVRLHHDLQGLTIRLQLLQILRESVYPLLRSIDMADRNFLPIYKILQSVLCYDGASPIVLCDR